MRSKKKASPGLAAEEVYHTEFFSATISAEDVKRETEKDPELVTVRSRLQTGWRPEDSTTVLATYYRKRLELSIEDGIIVWGRRVIIPKSLRARVVSLLHDGHQGIVRMKMRSRSYVWWPGLDEQLEAVVSECRCCLAVRNSPAVLKDSTWPTPQTPWERLHADFAGPIDPGRKMLLVMADASTKWPEIFLMDTTTSARTIEKLRTVFARFGIPKTVVSDNGAQFTSKEFQEFMSSNGIQHRMGAPFHPSTNGLAERLVQTVKKALKKMKGEPGSLQSKLSKFLFNYRNTPHPSTGKPPAVMLIGRLLRSHLDLLRPEKKTNVGEPIPAQFAEKQSVMVRDYRPGQKWQPGVIERRIGSYLYLVRTGDMLLKQHVDQILPLKKSDASQQPKIPKSRAHQRIFLLFPFKNRSEGRIHQQL